jgi:hypothetical protein
MSRSACRVAITTYWSKAGSSRTEGTGAASAISPACSASIQAAVPSTWTGTTASPSRFRTLSPSAGCDPHQRE